MVPLLRGSYKAQALSNFCFALGTFLSAGVSIVDGWRDAGRIAGWRPVFTAAKALSGRIESGCSPAPYFDQFSVFPDVFKSLYASGERTGKLDENLFLLAQQFQQQSDQKRLWAMAVYPTLILAAVILWVLTTVVRFYASYFNTLTHLMD